VNTAVHGILASLSSGFHTVKVASDQQVVGTYKTPWSAEANMVLSKDATVTTWSNTPITSTMTTAKQLPTSAAGQTVGDVTWAAGKNAVTVPVVLQGNLQGPGGWWRLTHPGNLFGNLRYCATRNPTWLMPVSIIWARRAAGRYRWQ
jgi:D-alanyl-D-alanine carboxypeptidase (penicillin-binding protein 5/6)